MKLSCLPISLFPAILDGTLAPADWARMAEAVGLDGFDFSMLFLRRHTPDYLDGLRAELADVGLPLVMITTYPDFTHPDSVQRERELEYLRHDIALASALGASFVRITAGQAHPGVGVAEGIGWVLDAFRRAAAVAARFGVRLVFENHSKPAVWPHADFSHPTAVFLEIADAIRGTGIGINFDMANTLAYGDDPLPVLGRVMEQVLTVHVADTAVRGRLEPVPLGTGAVPMRALLGFLKGRGFDGWLCIAEASGLGRLGIERATRFVREAWAARTESELAGSLACVEERGWTATPVFVASCRSAAGRLDAAGYQMLREALSQQLAAGLPADAIILHLHGAAAAEGVDDPEGDLLAMVRSELKFTGRVAVSLDLHANVTRRMLEHADVITAYRTFPHIDLPETGRRVVTLALDATVRTCAAAKLGMLLPPTSARSDAGDFARMQMLARQAEAEAGIADVALLPVQPWMDIAELGATVLVTGHGEAPARVAQSLARNWYAHRHAYPHGLMTMAAILRQLQEKRRHPWVLVDTADATTGGSTGRSAYVLQALRPHAQSFCAPVLLQVVDPGTVDRAMAGETTFEVGDQEVSVQAARVRTAEGRYSPRGLSYRGIETSMNGAAVIEVGALRIVASREPTLGVTDPAFYECVGLDPDAALAVQAKSLSGWMSGYVDSTDQGLYVDGPGATSLDFAALSFRPPNDNLFPIVEPMEIPLRLWRAQEATGWETVTS